MWKDILKHRSKLIPYFRFLVGTGESISFWEDPWLIGGRLIDQMGWFVMLQVGHSRAQVSDFIRNGRWVLPSSSNAAVNRVWAEISEIVIPSEGTRDRLVWTPSSSGLFSSKSAYISLLATSSTLDLAPVLWHADCVPKTNYCSFKAVLNRLLTQDRLLGMGL